MSDDRKKMPDDEFHFSDENHSPAGYQNKPYAPPEESTGKLPLWKKIFTRRVLIILGLIVAVMIIYFFTKPPIESDNGASRSSDNISSNPASIATQNVEDASAFERQIMQTEVLLKQQTDELGQKNSEEDDKIAQLQRSLLSINRNLADIQQNLSTLTSTVQNLQQQVSASQNQRPINTKPSVARKKPVNTVSYTLKAIVPGRAWILGSNGRTFTVRVGDPLSGYGIINAIDSNQGIVGTSSGKLIQYGPNDS